MASFEELTQEQSQLGDVIQAVLRRLKKDPTDRKNGAYLDKAERELNDAWSQFQANHQAMVEQQLVDANPLHPYIQQRFFESMQTVHENASALIATLRERLAPGPPRVRKASPVPPERFRVANTDDVKVDATVIKSIRRQMALIRNIRFALRDVHEKSSQQHPESYYQLKLQLIEGYNQQLSSNDNEIWESAASDEVEAMGYSAQEFNQVQVELLECISNLQRKLSHLHRSGDQHETPRILAEPIKLPKITLPIFDGDYHQWTHFKELYTQLVHCQPISPSQRMYYLLAHLTGEAKRLIQHLPISDGNYNDAWGILNDRYGNQRLLVNSLLNKLFSQPALSSESISAIKSLHDVTNECLLGLKNMGISIVSWDPLLLHLLLKKLDRSTLLLYEQKLEKPREIDTIQNFLKFLEMRFQSLEAAGNRSPSVASPRTGKPSSLVTAPGSEVCPVCSQPHSIYRCSTFASQSVKARAQIVQDKHLCYNCLKQGHLASNCPASHCKKCSSKHHTLLHPTTSGRRSTNHQSQEKQSGITLQSTTQPSGNGNQRSSSENKLVKSATTLAADLAPNHSHSVLLSTVLLQVKAADGRLKTCRAVLDCGSQLNFVTKKLASQLGLTSVREELCVRGIGQSSQTTQARVSLDLHSRTTGFTTRLEAFILPTIINQQPAHPINPSSWKIPANLELADPHFHQPRSVDLLIGAELYFDLLSIGQIKLGEALPTLQNTVFGWVIGGKVTNYPSAPLVCGINSQEAMQMEQQATSYWQLDEAKPTSTLTPHERKCEAYFAHTTSQGDDGRFTVKLPFVSDPTTLGESKDLTLLRFRALERKLMKDSNLRLQYTEFMQEYLRLGHMQLVDISCIQPPYYVLPHHGVLRPESTTTKLRVVFDASAKTSANVSLNDILHTGPSLQQDVFSILLRFRVPRFAFTADIEKMYRQVRMHKDDQKYQLIIWRNSPAEPIRYYRLCTVTYGITTAPYLAIKCLQRLAAQVEGSMPQGAEVIQRHIYVDDIMAGSDSLRQSLETKDQLIEALRRGGFHLRKWCANHPQLLQDVPTEDRAVQFELEMPDETHVKTLGLTWLPTSDEFCIKTCWPDRLTVTKRSISSDIAHLFDPLGMLSPVIIRAKIILKNLWILKLDWDAAVPQEIHSQWTRFREELRTLADIKFPRHLFAHKTPHNIQLHVFSDASEKAYGAAVYVRAENPDHTITIRLLCAKSKVAPTATTTIPRLELQAALLAAELATKVQRDLRWSDRPCTFWTDSEIVLAWLHSQSSSYYTYVANRVAAILEITSVRQWRHVPTAHNAADLVSRGVSPGKLKEHPTWFYGPFFLHGPERSWPSQPQRLETTLEMRPSKSVLTSSADDNIWERINHKNSFQRLTRITALLLRFKARAQRTPQVASKHLTAAELDAATKTILKVIQAQCFGEELATLKQKGSVSAQSSVATLTPFLDEKGIIRVGGRLEESQLPYDAKHPMLLPYNHPVCKMLMTDLHCSHAHVGPQGLLAITRQRFWPIKGKTTARSIVLGCVLCQRAKPKLLSQLMGNLPARRVQSARPFLNAGVDFCGPFKTHFKIRGKGPKKTYIAVFVCFSTKAVHLEVVGDLTTEAFIGALKRFTGRRGNCRHLYCDNATNFMGAHNQLKELHEAIYTAKGEEAISRFCISKGTDFHFIPPRAPHFGGLWEAAVKSAKHLLPASLQNVPLTHEELETVVTEVEAILNSRPLTPMSSDANDLTALTPGHFLIGEPLTSIPEADCKLHKGSSLHQWHRILQVKNQFWQRWTNEYLSELQQRHRWKEVCQNVTPGTMVILKEDNLAPLQWPLARIVETIKGRDGLVRVAIVKTASGTFKRPIHRIAPLPVEVASDEPISDDQSMNEASPSNESATPAVDCDIPTSQEQYDPGEGPSRGPKSHPSSEQPKVSSHPKRRRLTGTNALCLVLMCCLLPTAPAHSPITITPFQHNPGLYFEKIGYTHLVVNHWNLIVYYNMTNYWREAYTIEQGIRNLDSLCGKLADGHFCHSTVLLFTEAMQELNRGNELLHNAPRSRKRRAPFNIVGNVASSLFGVLDSTYAEGMAATIQNLEDNEIHLHELLRNQTSIIDSTINIMRKSHQVLQEQMQEFEDYLNRTSLHLNQIESELQEHRILEHFNSLSARVILLVSKYSRMQSTLIDVVTDSHHGKVNPMLLAPNQLAKQLTIIRDNLPPTLRLPTTHNSLAKTYSLLSIQGAAVREKLIFKLALPLFPQDTYELFRIIPMPSKINNTFMTIVPTSSLLVVNLQRDLFYPMSDAEASHCTVLHQNHHICIQQHPLLRKTSNVSRCEMAILTQMPATAVCHATTHCELPTWIQLSTPNHWLYVLAQETNLRIVCAHTVITRTLSGSGILNISRGCTLTDEVVILQANAQHAGRLDFSFNLSSNITDFIATTKSPLHPALLKIHSNTTEDLLRLQSQLKQLHQSETHLTRGTIHDTHHYSLGYTNLLLIGIIAGVFLYAWLQYRGQRSTRRETIPIPAPRIASRASFNIDPELHL